MKSANFNVLSEIKNNREWFPMYLNTREFYIGQHCFQNEFIKAFVKTVKNVLRRRSEQYEPHEII